MEQSAVETPTAPVEGQPAPAAEGTTQNGQTTDQKPAPEVTQEKDDQEQHRSRAYRRLDRWRQRAIEAEAQLKAFREVQGRQPERQPQQQASDEPVRESFNSYEEYVEARAAWRAEKVAEEKARKILDETQKKSEQERTKGEHDKLLRDWNAKVEKARDLIEDFDDVTAEAADVALTPTMSEAIIESDIGPQIAYYLAKNPAEAERISKLTKARQAAEIVKLEEKVARPAKQPSKAPEPITPVGQKAEVEKDPSKMSDKEFAEWRRRQIAQRR